MVYSVIGLSVTALRKEYNKYLSNLKHLPEQMNGFPILGSRGPMEESRPFPRLSSPPDSNASSPTPSSLESYGERELGVHPSEKVFNFPASSSTDSGGPVTLTSLTPISPSNEVAG